MIFHFISLPLIFYPMYLLWKQKVSICCLNSSFIYVYFRVTLRVWVTWRFSLLLPLPLCLGSTGGLSQAHFLMGSWRTLVLGKPPGPTISLSILHRGTATSLTLWVQYPFIQNISFFNKGWSSSWIHSSPHTWQGCQGGPNCQHCVMAGEQIERKVLL